MSTFHVTRQIGPVHVVRARKLDGPLIEGHNKLDRLDGLYPAIQKFWRRSMNNLNELLEESVTKLALPLAAMVVVIIVGVYVIRKVRDGSAKQAQQTSDMMTNLRELNAQGQISDDEYRTIKTKLVAQLHKEIKDTDTTG